MKTDTLVTLLSLVLTLAAMMYPHDPVHKSEDTSGAARRGEHLLIFALLTATLLLRFAYVFRYPIESDEPQHLHVVWGLVYGHPPSRDVYTHPLHVSLLLDPQ